MIDVTSLKSTIVVEHKCMLGEGPVWDGVQKVICWVDILNGEIHEYSPEHKTHKIIPVHQMIGSFAVCTDGKFIAALQNGFAFIDRVSGAIKKIADFFYFSNEWLPIKQYCVMFTTEGSNSCAHFIV